MYLVFTLLNQGIMYHYIYIYIYIPALPISVADMNVCILCAYLYVYIDWASNGYSWLSILLAIS